MDNSTELQKPNVGAEVHNNNKKCDWGEKKLKSLIGFHSANKIKNYSQGRGWGWGGRKKRKRKNNPKESTGQNKNSRFFSWVSTVRVLFLAGSHSPLHLPRMPSNTVLISRPVAGVAQILIWSLSCVFFPPLSTDLRTSAFSFVGALNDLLYIPQTQSLPSL